MSEHKRISPETPPDGSKPLKISFTPAPVRPRGDGWTAERQIAFIEKLAGGNTVTAACRHVGMSRESARKLRCHPQGRAFRDAWDAAVDCRYAEVEEAALERSKNGVPRPIFYKGEQVGEWRYFDERMTMFLLRFRRRHRFGPEADTLPRPPTDLPSLDPDEQLPFDPEGEFEGGIVGIEFGPEPPPEEPDAAWPEADADDEQ